MSDADSVLQGVFSDQGRIKALCEGLIDALEHRLAGRVLEASTTINTMMGTVRPLLVALNSNATRLGPLYRSRTDERPANLGRRDLYHIPNHLRHLVATQRYSVPGVPMLYLGSTSYVCWEELGRPPLEQVSSMAYHLVEPEQVRILNLAQGPAVLRHFGDLDESDDRVRSRILPYLRAAISMWPVQFACSIRVHETLSLIHI